MTILIVPNELLDQIDNAIDRELAGRPIADDDRQYVQSALLAFYDEHGAIPEFTLGLRTP